MHQDTFEVLHLPEVGESCICQGWARFRVDEAQDRNLLKWITQQLSVEPDRVSTAAHNDNLLPPSPVSRSVCSSDSPSDGSR
jgi:hypothetical protein